MYRLTIAVLLAIWPITILCKFLPSVQDHKMPPRCEGKTFCTIKSKNYPETQINNLLYGVENYFVDANETEHIGNRGSTRDDCESSLNNNPIYQIIDDKNKIRYVVQNKDRFKQFIRIKECRKKGRITESTSNFDEDTIMNFNMTCHQWYLDFKFLVLSEDGTSLDNVRVKGGVPVDCSCEYSRMDDEYY